MGKGTSAHTEYILGGRITTVLKLRLQKLVNFVHIHLCPVHFVIICLLCLPDIFHLIASLSSVLKGKYPYHLSDQP